MYNKQFLFTTEKIARYDWYNKEIGRYNLYYHPNLEYTFAEKNDTEIHLLGSLYDWEEPSLSNKAILDKLINAATKDKLFTEISNYSGAYVLLFRHENEILIFNDACAQSEIYYDDEFRCFGTQAKLLAEVIKLVPHDDQQAVDYYNSSVFNKKCLFVGESTHAKNIKHLLPNHYIEIASKCVKRFFPIVPISKLSVAEVAPKASVMIKGYLKAISLRNTMAVAVTGGYDSRILFLASLDMDCKYYVSKHSNMDDSHYDIAIPQKLASIYNKEFSVIPDIQKTKDDFVAEYAKSVDFPRYLNFVDTHLDDCVIINGNISEVARNYFGYNRNVSAEDLCYLNGFSLLDYPTIQYRNWMETNRSLFDKLDYNFLDMFYWEEKMGNWAAKAKTEFAALGKTMISPFNSRALLVLLLSVDRKYRDSHTNVLYNEILAELSNRNKEVMKIPINPCRKQQIIGWMKTFKLYELYRNIGLKTRRLKI